MAVQPYAIGREQLPANAADGYPRGGLARAGTFDHLAHVVVAVFERAGKIGMTRAHACHRLDRRRLGWKWVGGHALAPVDPVAILDPQRNGRAQGVAVTHAGEDLDGVLLDLHAPAATIAALAPSQ